MGPNSRTLAVERSEDIEAVLSRYAPALYRFAFRQLRNHEDAEDAVQDALLSAFKHISQFQGRSAISTWLHRIVINSARMQLRRRRNRTFLSLDETELKESSHFADRLVDSGLSPEQTCGQAELRGIVQQLLKELSPRLASAIQLRHLDGLSCDESARALGVTRTTLKSRVHRARASLGRLVANPHLARLKTARVCNTRDVAQTGT